MNSQTPNIESRNVYWDKRFEGGAIYGERPSLIMEKIAPYLENTKDALVVGGGYGRNAAFLADKGLEVTNTDVSENAINLGKKIYKDKKNLKFEQGNIVEMTDSMNRFDSVVCIYVLSLLNDDEVEKALSNLKNSLLSNGKLICNFLSIDDDEYGLGEPIDKNLFLLDQGKQLVKFYDEEEIRKILKNHGFKIINISKEEEGRFVDVLNREITTRSWVVVCEKVISEI